MRNLCYITAIVENANAIQLFREGRVVLVFGRRAATGDRSVRLASPIRSFFIEKGYIVCVDKETPMSDPIKSGTTLLVVYKTMFRSRTWKLIEVLPLNDSLQENESLSSSAERIANQAMINDTQKF